MKDSDKYKVKLDNTEFQIIVSNLDSIPHYDRDGLTFLTDQGLQIISLKALANGCIRATIGPFSGFNHTTYRELRSVEDIESINNILQKRKRYISSKPSPESKLEMLLKADRLRTLSKLIQMDLEILSVCIVAFH